MKTTYLVLIPDGMADVALDVLGGLTPLEAAPTPAMDALARRGRVGLVRNVPRGMEPGSDVAIMSIMGCDPAVYYTGRGPLEAASLGVDVPPGHAAFRCNLIHVKDDLLIDYSAGHITTEESGELIAALSETFARDGLSFHHGVSFRNLLLLKSDCAGLRTHAPHDHMDEPWETYLPSGAMCAETLVEIIMRSRDVLENHPVNNARAARGARPANMAWPWSGGCLPDMGSFEQRYGLRAAVISAVDLVQGLGRVLGMDVIKVPGATGMVDTNYEGKAAAAIAAFDTHDIVFLHVEGTDEAAHIGDVALKQLGIERFDARIVAPVMSALQARPAWRALLLPDHPTPIPIRTHTSEPVPFVAAGGDVSGPGANAFTEKSAADANFEISNGHELMAMFLNDRWI